MTTRILAVALCVAACSTKKTEQPPPEPTPEPQQPPAQELDVDALWDRWTAAASALDGAALRPLYAEGATVIPASSGMTVTGGDAIVEFFTGFAQSIEDLETVETLRLVNGTTLASVSRTRGKQAGKQVSFTGLSIVEIDHSGKIAKQTLYADNLSYLAQLGSWDGPHRAYDESGAAARRRAERTGSKAEADNVRLVGGMIDAFNAGDTAALAAAYAPGAVVSDQSAAADVPAADYWATAFAGFGEPNKSDLAMWSAGDWVVVTCVLTAKHTGAVPRLKLTKGSGTAIRVEVGEVLRVQDGKVAEHWIFADAMAIGAQLGALKIPGM